MEGGIFEKFINYIMYCRMLGEIYIEIVIYRPGTFGQGISVTADDGIFYARLKNKIFPTTLSLNKVKIVIDHK